MKGNTIQLTSKDRTFLAQMFEKERFPQDLYPYFEKTYCTYIEGALCPDDYDSSLKLAKKQVEIVIGQLKMGHSLDWADLYADKEIDFDEYIVYEVYKELQSRDKELAMCELKKHAEALLSDDIAKEMYVKIVADDYYFSDRETKEKAIRYSSLYKREVANGNPDFYAEKYACAVAVEECSEEYARLSAELFDFASKKGKTNPMECDAFINDCVEAYINNYFTVDYKKLLKQYTKEWQQEALTMLNRRIEEDSENCCFDLPCREKRSIDAGMMDMMYPEGCEDDEMSKLYDDDL